MNVMVSVICNAYNQERYIAQCLDSLVSQSADFDYEIIVHDDASTDCTTQIIREYEKRYSIIKAVYEQENQYSQNKSFVHKTYGIARGKYIAFCEGDDFWTCNTKLQKQVDFLESHKDYVLCGHAAYYANEDGSLNQKRFFRSFTESRDLTTVDILSGWVMATNSFVYLKSARGIDPIPFRGDCKRGDFATMVYLSLRGKVFYMNELMSAYRTRSIGSATWNSMRDDSVRRNNTNRFIAMLSRIDQYTDGVYHNEIESRQRRELFTQALVDGNIEIAKSYSDLYRKLPYKMRLFYLLKRRFPLLLKLRSRIKGLINRSE